MRRLVIFGAFGLALVFFALLYVENAVKSPRPATVHLKPGSLSTVDRHGRIVNDLAGEREGVVTTTEKYVTVESDRHGKEIFTWDQILYISDSGPSNSRLGWVVLAVDLLSKVGLFVGLFATVLTVIGGLHQYYQMQKWEREKFLATVVKEFQESKRVRNAKQMLDSLVQYPTGRYIELLEAEKPEDRRVLVTNNEIYLALTTTPEILVEPERAAIIRECFDDYLSGLVTFCHYVDQGLITTEALMAHTGYWIELLGPEGDLDARYKRRVLGYAENYGLLDVETLIVKYHKNF